MKKLLITISIVVLMLHKLYSQTDQVTFPFAYFDLNAQPRTQLNPMSIKLFDDYRSFRPSPAIAPGNNSYGTLLALYGRNKHWEHNLYFGANKKIYYRMAVYPTWTAEDGTLGGYNEWRTILDSKSDVESSGDLKIKGNGSHYIEKGNVGIGTTNPTEKMSIYNSTVAQTAIQYGNQNTGNGSGNGFLVGIESGGNGIVWNRENNYIRFGTNAQERIRILANGNVGIGTPDPGSYKLAVEGKIGAHEVVVTTEGWADFVFEPEYNLMSLGELETFVKKNKHLPEIPSAAEVQENGVSVGEMNAKLLQKIEELTLYLIEKNKEIKVLQNEVLDLKTKLKN